MHFSKAAMLKTRKSRLFVKLLPYYFIICSDCWSPAKAELTDVVQTDKGRVRGEILETVGTGTKYSSFRGIPFAKPPINELRFRPPVEADSWSDVINATAELPPCFQIHLDTKVLAGQEDCLYLNVYTPKTKFNRSNKNPLAVMVWIYGGGFCAGVPTRSFYGPDFLIDENVVVVAMNYRLGPLGFLSLNHPNATGNMGLKDQVLALKWVQKNIAAFGGDPGRVTLFGLSAGAASISFHQISDASAGLFNASIAMSGSALNPWAFHTLDNVVSRAFALGKQLGFKTSSKKKLLKKLLNVAPEILTVEATKFPGNTPMMNCWAFKPTIENEKISVDTILSDCPYCKFRSGSAAKKPTMLGVVEYETLTMKQEDGKLLDKIMNLMADSLDMDFEQTDEIRNVTSSGFFFNAGVDQMQQYLVASGAPVYYYKNSFDHESSLHRLSGFNLAGTHHADDIFHIFYPRNFYENNESAKNDKALAHHRRKMVRMWTNFAKYL